MCSDCSCWRNLVQLLQFHCVASSIPELKLFFPSIWSPEVISLLLKQQPACLAWIEGPMTTANKQTVAYAAEKQISVGIKRQLIHRSFLFSSWRYATKLILGSISDEAYRACWGILTGIETCQWWLRIFKSIGLVDAASPISWHMQLLEQSVTLQSTGYTWWDWMTIKILILDALNYTRKCHHDWLLDVKLRFPLQAMT